MSSHENEKTNTKRVWDYKFIYDTAKDMEPFVKLPNAQQFLTLSWRRLISYRKQYDIEYDNGLRHERVNYFRRKAKSKMFDRVLNIHLVVCITNFLIFKLLYCISNFHIFVKTLPGISTAQKWSFLLRISSVNVPKSGASSGFGHVYWRNP